MKPTRLDVKLQLNQTQLNCIPFHQHCSQQSGAKCFSNPIPTPSIPPAFSCNLAPMSPSHRTPFLLSSCCYCSLCLSPTVVISSSPAPLLTLLSWRACSVPLDGSHASSPTQLLTLISWSVRSVPSDVTPGLVSSSHVDPSASSSTLLQLLKGSWLQRSVSPRHRQPTKAPRNSFFLSFMLFGPPDCVAVQLFLRKPISSFANVRSTYPTPDLPSL